MEDERERPKIERKLVKLRLTEEQQGQIQSFVGREVSCSVLAIAVADLQDRRSLGVAILCD
jgi:hypothetical protein